VERLRFAAYRKVILAVRCWISMRMKRLPIPLALAAITFVGVAAQTGGAASRSTLAQAQPPRLVGLWTTIRTCQGLRASARKAGLAKLAPVMVADDYFPGQSPQQLALKRDLCSGATPQRHSHFFNKQGRFGSVNQHGSQADWGVYRIVNGTVKIRTKGSPSYYGFRYKIVGKELSLVPLIPAELVRLARTDPFEANEAAWMAAVAYSGHTWKRAPCGRWC
jgi:hypothetical protein